MSKISRRLNWATAALVLTLGGSYWGGIDRSSLYPSSSFARQLPWSAPLLRFWANYHNRERRAEALEVMMDAGGPYRQEAWQLLLQQNQEPDNDSALLLAKSPAQVDLLQTAVQAVTPDRPAQAQLAALYLQRHRELWWPQALASRAQFDRRKRLLLLSLLADWGQADSGQLVFEQANPIPAPARIKIQEAFGRECREAGLLETARPGRVSAPNLATAPPQAVYDWLSDCYDPHILEKLLLDPHPAYSERAAVQLWFLPDPDRVRLRPYLTRLLSKPMADLCAFRLGPLELLSLAQAFPQSRLTRGCLAFSRLRGGKYFGDYLYWSGSGEKLPKLPAASSEQWRAWLAEYPDHPGADDAAYWLGRSLEHHGARYEAFVFFLKQVSHLPGDQDIQGRWRDHVLWLLDVGVNAEDLERFTRDYPDSPANPLVVYSLALRRARGHDYGAALRLTENLDLKAAYRDSLGADEYSNDWDLAQPDVSRIQTFRPPASLQEDLNFQRGLWQRCVQLQGSGSARELYELGAFWSEAGGWRIGYSLLLQGQRTFLWCYSWDAYARDSRADFRPDAAVLLREGRLANQNEAVFALMNRVLELVPESTDEASQTLREKARYNRFAALQAQCTRDAEAESTFLGRDFFQEACQEGRLLLRDFPGTPLARNVFLSLSEIKERPGIEKFLQIHFPRP